MKEICSKFILPSLPPSLPTSLLPFLPPLSQNLREIQLHDLTTHLDIFEDHKEQDFEEMLHRLNDIRIELKYPLMSCDPHMHKPSCHVTIT